jgi:hypothetical protein
MVNYDFHLSSLKAEKKVRLAVSKLPTGAAALKMGKEENSLCNQS